MKQFFAPLGAVLIAVLAGCSAPPVPAEPPVTAPIVTAPAPGVVAPPGAPARSGTRMAAPNPVLEQWKRQAAERVHAVNASQLFEGRPHHLLQAVIVMDVTVDRSGKVTRAHIVRSPGIARLNNVAQASIKAASPLPTPPASLVKTGAMTYSETWLVANDGRWRLRTLSQAQE